MRVPIAVVRFILRILLVTQNFPPKIFGGGEISAYLLAKSLSESHEVHVISAGPGKMYELDGIRVHPLIRPSRLPFPEDMRRNEAFYFSVYRAVSKFLRNQGKFDIVHSTYTRTIGGAVPAARRRGIPAVATINDPWATCFFQTHFREGNICKECSRSGIRQCLEDIAQRRSGIIYLRGSMWLRRHFIEKCSGLMTNSAAMKDLLQKNGIKKNIKVIPSAVDLDMFGYEKPKLSGNILYIGRVDLGKGVDVAIKAFAKANCGKLVVAGTGALLKDCKKLVKELGIEEKVEFRGKIPYENVPSVIHEADIVLVPFQRIEAYGRVLLEANACGRGVITTTIGADHTHIRKGVNGLIFEPEDIEGMAHGIQELMDKPRVIEEMGISGRKIVEENFTIELLGKRVNSFYSDILGDAG
jgi:glycosyltransferase involved in cell wall biosynthesis